jgi:hypothetical protein
MSPTKLHTVLFGAGLCRSTKLFFSLYFTNARFWTMKCTVQNGNKAWRTTANP